MKRPTIQTSLLLCVLVLGCTKQEIRQINLKGDFIVTVSTSSEFGTSINDKADIKLILEGTDPKTEVFTDTSGKYTFKDLPMGTYNLVVSKDGYGTMKYQNIQFLGGDKPYNYSVSLVHKSTTKVKSYELGISGTNLTITGVISHQYPKSDLNYYPFNWPSLFVYVSNLPDVDSVHYYNYNSFCSNEDNDTTFTTTIYLNTSYFPSGTTAYTKIYGTNRIYYWIYDYETGKFYDPGLGEPSEIKSIVVP